jgi:hypothetical protein
MTSADIAELAHPLSKWTQSDLVLDWVGYSRDPSEGSRKVTGPSTETSPPAIPFEMEWKKRREVGLFISLQTLSGAASLKWLALQVSRTVSCIFCRARFEEKMSPVDYNNRRHLRKS